MPTIRDQAFATAAALDALLAQQPDSDKVSDLSGAASLREGETFAAALKRQIDAAEDETLADPDQREQAQHPTAPRNFMHNAAEQAGDDAASDWLDEIASMEALYALPVAA